MKRTLVGVVVVILGAAAGFFGLEFYVQHQIIGEIEVAFEQLRAAGTKASHGKVSYDLLNRTVTVADIGCELATQPPSTVKLASLTAFGVSHPDATQFSANRIEATDLTIEARSVSQAGWSMTYKAPRITVKDYSGPAGLQWPLTSSSAVDVYRFALEHFAAITASSVTVPSLAVAVGFPDARGKKVVEYNYSNLALRNIKNGRIAAMNVERADFSTRSQQDGKEETIDGKIIGMATYDFDSGAVLAVLDPARTKDDTYVRVYRQTTIGAYTIALPQGTRVRIDGMTLDDIGLRPSKLQVPQLAAMIASVSQAGANLTTAQTRDILETIAGTYEGLHIGNAEMRGLATDTPQGPFKLAAIRFNMKNGKIGELAIEGLDARSPQGPVKIERFALKSFDVANLLRLTSAFSNPEQKPSPDQVLGMFRLLEGAEIKGLVAPDNGSNRPISIDTLSLNWGQFVGPIPSKAHLAAKFTIPINAADLSLKQLIGAGMKTAAIDFDLGAAWTEASGGFVLDPVTLEFGDVLKASARISLANVNRGVFSLDPMQATAMASQIDAGPMEITLRDIGGINLAVAQYAQAQKLSSEEARHALIESITANAKTMTDSSDVLVAAEALAGFIENPRGTLILKLTPLDKVPAMQIIQLMKTEPLLALAQFRIEVSSGL